MTLAELGSLGEFVAAVATILTLVYLALQIRQSNRLLEDSARRGIQDDADRWRAYLINSKDIASLYRSGLMNSTELDDEDRLRYRMLQDQLFFGWEYAYFSDKKSLDRSGKRFLIDTLNQPGGKEYWNATRHKFDEEFVNYVNECVEN